MLTAGAICLALSTYLLAGGWFSTRIPTTVESNGHSRKASIIFMIMGWETRRHQSGFIIMEPCKGKPHGAPGLQVALPIQATMTTLRFHPGLTIGSPLIKNKCALPQTLSAGRFTLMPGVTINTEPRPSDRDLHSITDGKLIIKISTTPFPPFALWYWYLFFCAHDCQVVMTWEAQHCTNPPKQSL